LLNESGQVIGVVPHFDAKEQANASPAAIIRQIVSKSRANALLPFAKRPRTDSTAPLCFDSNFRAGVKAMGQNDWVEAERRMRRAAKDFRQSAVPLACLAVICTGRESWKATHAYCEKALRLSPDCGLVHMLDGTSLLALQRADHGVAAVRKGLELGLPDNPTRILAWTLLATVETSLGHEGQAQEALDNLRRLDADAAASLRNKLQNSTKTRFKPAAKESN
jgi:predicted Zn-dependent protease